MTHEIHKSVERSSRRGALMMGAVLVGGLVEWGRAAHEKRQPNETGVISYYEDDGPSYTFAGGCSENLRAQAPLFHRKLGGLGSLHFVYQVQGEDSQEEVDWNLIKAFKSDGDRDRVLLGSSQGTMKILRSLANPAVRTAIGKGRLKAFVSLEGITSKHNLQPRMQEAAAVSSALPRLPIIGDAWRLHRLHKANGEIAHSEGTTIEEAHLHHESSAHMPWRLITSQHKAIHESAAWQPGSLQIVSDENPDLHLYQISSEYDAVADWKKTNRSLEEVFGLPVEHISDNRRSHGGHADTLEFIEPLEELMMKISGRHRDMATAAKNLVAYSDGRGFALAS